MKKYTAFVSSVVALALVVTTNPCPEVLSPGRQDHSTSTLSPWTINDPIQGDIVLERALVEAGIMYAVLKDPDVLGLGMDMTALVDDKNLNIGFSGMSELKLPERIAEIKGHRRSIIPCEVEDRGYYAHVAYDASRKENFEVIAVHSEDEYDKDIKGLVEAVPVAQTPADKVVLEVGKLRFIGEMDKKAGMVTGFLKAIGSNMLEAEFKEIIGSHDLLVSKKAAFVLGSIVVDEKDDPDHQARSILAQLMARNGISLPAIKSFEEAFNGFMRDQGSFDLDRFDPGLRPLVMDLERKGRSAGNEGYIQFESYPEIYDLSSRREMTMKDYSVPVIRNIRLAIETVLHHDMEELGITEEPGFELEVKEISEGKAGQDNIWKGLLPTMIIEKIEQDGVVKFKVRVNPNFVKILFKLGPRGLHDARGDIRDLDSDKYIGHMYNAIIFSAVIHEIRGHIRMTQGGKIMFNPDEFWAQGERGSSFLYVNVLAMLFYWLVLVERCPHPELRTRLFMMEHPEVFRNLTAEQRQKLPKHLLQVCDDLKELNFFGEGEGYRPRNLGTVSTRMSRQDYEKVIDTEGITSSSSNDKVETNKADKVTPADVFELLCCEGAPLTLEQLEASARNRGMSRADIHEGLALLMGLELVDLIEPNRPDVMSLPVPIYKVLPINETQRHKISAILAGIDIQTDRRWSEDIEARIEKLTQAKVRIMKITERRWGNSLLNALFNSRPAKLMKERGEELILAIESEWVPEGQEDFVKEIMQELGKFDKKQHIRIVRGSREELAGKIEKARSGKIPLKNVVILAGKDALKRDDIRSMTAASDEDKDKAFFVGVDPKNLKKDSYVRIVEMLSMAVRMAYGLRPITRHPHISVDKINSRLVIFIPEAEPFDMEEIKAVYGSQKKLLTAA